MTNPEPLPAPEAIARRRATQRFDPSRPVADDLLKRVLHLATFAPSGFNLQPWRFVVVRDGRNRRKLMGCAFNQPRVGEAPAVVIVLGYHDPDRSHLGPMVDRMLAIGAIAPGAAAELRRGPPARWTASPTAPSGRPARRCSPRPR